MKAPKFNLAARPLAIFATVLSLAIGALGSEKTTETVLYAFQGAGDGEFAFSGLTFDSAGSLYGTTVFGGILCGIPTCGTVYQLVPPVSPGGAWSKNVLYDFWTNPDDGGFPRSGVFFDKVGNLYGTTSGGGQNADCPNCGTVFQLAPPSTPGASWTENVLHRFESDPDGASPWGPLTFDSAGNLFGTTNAGGPYGASGTIFEMTPPAQIGGAWTESVIYTFDFLGHGGEGCEPLSGVIMDKAGDLYGTTEDCGADRPHHCPGFGCGTVFKLTRPAAAGDPWRYKVLHLFQDSPSDGSYPMAGLVFDNAGNLYGTTSYGGLYRSGTVFKLTPPLWTETVIYNFAGGTDGSSPQGGLVFHNGSLYGTTVEGGVGCTISGPGCGTVFQLTPQSGGESWTESVIYRFHGSDGVAPFGTLLFGEGDTLFGTTGYGGDGANCQNSISGCGTVFELAP
jgi:uncharacterized repeat protein (TIGR03803 family)